MNYRYRKLAENYGIKIGNEGCVKDFNEVCIEDGCVAAAKKGQYCAAHFYINRYMNSLPKEKK